MPEVGCHEMDEEKGRKGRVLCKSLKSMWKEEHLTGIRVGRNRMSGKGPVKTHSFLTKCRSNKVVWITTNQFLSLSFNLTRF